MNQPTASTDVWLRCRPLLCMLSWLFPAVLLADEPQRLLADMARAIDTLNYKGTLVYMQPGRAETFRVFHRVDGDQVTEKVIALDGAGAEVIRTPEEVICIFPDQRKVVVDRRNGKSDQQGLLRANLPAFTPDLTNNYDLKLLGEDRVADRMARVVAIEPEDDLRYGYRLWLDHVSSMPLKIQLLASETEIPVEELFFTAISLPDVMEESLVQASDDTSAFQWVRRGEDNSSVSAPVTEIHWRAENLPAGFMETVATLEYLSPNSSPRTHLVYSDGLASVSVFVDLAVAASEQVEGPTAVGATNAYSLMIDGFLVTAMGEVPAPTVQMIARSMGLQLPAAAPPP